MAGGDGDGDEGGDGDGDGDMDAATVAIKLFYTSYENVRVCVSPSQGRVLLVLPLFWPMERCTRYPTHVCNNNINIWIYPCI